MSIYLRNKATGEIREVEPDSSEFRELQKQVTPAGLTMWEQTHFAHAEAIKDRAAYGELQEEDLGHEAQDELRFEALKLADEGVGPEVNPHLQLTPGEVEMGMTPESKLADLEAQYSRSRGVRQRVFDQSADAISDERKERHPPTGEVISARAGGSDDRENAPFSGLGGEGEEE